MPRNSETIRVNYGHWHDKSVTLKPNSSYSGMAFHRRDVNLKVAVSFNTDSECQINGVRGVSATGSPMNDISGLDWASLKNDTTGDVIIDE